MLTDEEFLKLFNTAIDMAKPVSAEESYAKSINDSIKDLSLDSLDWIMLGIFLGDALGVCEATMRDMKPTSLADVKSYLEEHTAYPETSYSECEGRLQ